jgi:hypothetical protein
MSRNNIQSILFDKQYWTPQLAKEWLKLHNYKTHFGKKKYHETENMLRFRQSQPKKGSRYRIIKLGDHIEAVMMYS